MALAVFEDNFAVLETLAADPDSGAFGRLWSRLVELTIETSAFVEMVIDARENFPEYRGHARLADLVEATLPRAQRAGLADAGLETDDVLLAWRMAFGVVVTTADRAQVRPAVTRALSLLPLP